MQKEILLVRKVFTSRHLGKTRGGFIHTSLTKKLALLGAYNNLLLSIMPIILKENSGKKKLFICKMSESLLLLELKFGEINLELESHYSIDPYSFLPSQIFS